MRLKRLLSSFRFLQSWYRYRNPEVHANLRSSYYTEGQATELKVKSQKPRSSHKIQGQLKIPFNMATKREIEIKKHGVCYLEVRRLSSKLQGVEWKMYKAGEQVVVLDRKLQETEEKIIRATTHEQIINSFASSTEKMLERMWDPKILIHKEIAVLWTKYDFHRGGKFSHCGVDAFNLIKTPGGWKISGIFYTVEKEGCEESPLGPPIQ